MAKYPQKLRAHTGVVARLVPTRIVVCLSQSAQAGTPVVTPEIEKRLAHAGLELEAEPAAFDLLQHASPAA